jgi:hypothetical protein
MRTRDLISAPLLILVSIGTCIMAYRLGLGSGSSPGPGFAAFGIASLLGLMSVYLFVKALIQSLREGKRPEEVPRIAWSKPMLILVTLAGYGMFLNTLGFPFCTLLLMMLLVCVFGRQRLRLAVTVSILTVFSSYALFVMGLGLPLPMGSLWYFLGQ